MNINMEAHLMFPLLFFLPKEFNDRFTKFISKHINVSVHPSNHRPNYAHCVTWPNITIKGPNVKHKVVAVSFFRD